MSNLVIFAFGLFVTLITLLAMVLIGLSEAADPDLSRPEDLDPWEEKLVGQDRRGHQQET